MFGKCLRWINIGGNTKREIFLNDGNSNNFK